MSKFIPQKRLDKKLIENVLAISTEAKAAKMADNSVINATSGTYYDDDGNMHVFEAIRNEFEKCDYNHDLSYSGMIGPKEIKELVTPHILGDDYKEVYKDYIFQAAASIGGTGAISMAMCNYAEEDSYILLPSIRWPSYYQIALNHNLKPLDYDLFNEEGTFNFKSLEEKINFVAKTQNKVEVVVNDPCHNPSGYSMTDEEYIELVNVLNKCSKKICITLLLDIAYLDYGFDKGNKTRASYIHLKDLSDNVQVLFAFSASKTFGIYGLRAGALVHMTKDEEEAKSFTDTAKFFARSTWSNPNHQAVNIIVNTLGNDKSKNQFLDELRVVSKNLLDRGNLMVEKLDQYGVPHYPYLGGFFVFITIEDEKFLAELKANKVHACTMNHGVRFAVSSINREEAVRLGEIVGLAYKHYKENN